MRLRCLLHRRVVQRGEIDSRGSGAFRRACNLCVGLRRLCRYKNSLRWCRARCCFGVYASTAVALRQPKKRRRGDEDAAGRHCWRREWRRTAGENPKRARSRLCLVQRHDVAAFRSLGAVAVKGVEPHTCKLT